MYKNNKNVGKASVTIKGKGSYTGKRMRSFKIKPMPTALEKSARTEEKVTIKREKRAKQVTGYQPNKEIQTGVADTGRGREEDRAHPHLHGARGHLLCPNQNL